MLEELLSQPDGTSGIDNLNSLSDDVMTQMDDIIPVEPAIPEDSINPSEILTREDIQDLKPEVNNNVSFKGGACVCSCDMSCTVGY